MTRRELIHGLRRDYEGVVTQVQTLEEAVLLTSEVVVWPKENTLCLPRFVVPCEHSTDVPIVHTPEQDPPTLAEVSNGVQDDSHSDSQLSTHTDIDATGSPPTVEHSTIDGLELPKSKEGLKELREQLSLELLWLKQAIVSRQNVGCWSIINTFLPCSITLVLLVQ